MSLHAKAVVVLNELGEPVRGATVQLNANDACGPRMGRTNDDGYVMWAEFPDSVLISDVRVWAPGYADYAEGVHLIPDNQTVRVGGPAESGDPQDVHLPAVVRSFPDAPTRSQVCGVRLTFQGLTVVTQQWGPLPWFEPALDALQPVDRQAVYAAKHQQGDTHAILHFGKGGSYGVNDHSQPYWQIVSPNHEANLLGFRNLVEEILEHGFTPVIAYDGDNADDPVNGYPNALRQLPILTDLMGSGQDINPYILYARFWDGVFYGSTPENIQAFGQAFRQLLPNGHLAIEHNPGHIPVGGGPGDYQPGGRMSDYDVVFSEFLNGIPRTADPNPDTNPGGSLWMVIDRLVHPFVRPADMPTGPRWDSGGAPFYLAGGNARGPYFYNAFEWDEYRWVRGQVSAEEVAAARSYIQAMGCQYTG